MSEPSDENDLRDLMSARLTGAIVWLISGVGWGTVAILTGKVGL